MLTNRAVLRFTTALAVSGLLQAQFQTPVAFAQPAQPPAAPSADNSVQTADPPTRAGRLARISGNVSFHAVGADRWDRASINFPITGGYSFWTDTGAQADIEVAASRLVMDAQTQIDVTTLDAVKVGLVLPQGEVFLRLRALVPGETYTLQTPRGSVSINADGHYAIFAGDTGTPTRITVLDGAAHVTGPNIALDIGPNQAGVIQGTDNFTGQVVAAEIDAFTRAQLDRERPPPQAAVPQAVMAMPGGAELSSYGSWATATDYGQVWYPPVQPGWVPYRDGHWAWVAPWGWTWIDDEPWGFAPSHYGRWVEIGDRWAWAPGFYDPGLAYVQPVYAPALVSFFDFSAGVALGAGLGLAFGGNIGWCPLGWGEPFRPWFHASNNFLVDVNIHNVRNFNITNITNNVTINNFAHRNAMTAMPVAAMAASAEARRFAQPLDARRLSTVHPVVGREPLSPTAHTLGISAGLARRMNLPQGATGFAGSRHPSKGPDITAGSGRTGHGGLPPLSATARGTTAHPGNAPMMQGGVAPSIGSRVGLGNAGRAGLPPLAAPGHHPPAGIREGRGPAAQIPQTPHGMQPPRTNRFAAPGAAGSQLPALRGGRNNAVTEPRGPSGTPANRGFDGGAPTIRRGWANPGHNPVTPHFGQQPPRQAMPRRPAPQEFRQQASPGPHFAPRAPERTAPSFARPRQFSAPRPQQVIPQGDGGPPTRSFTPRSQGYGRQFMPRPPQGRMMSAPHGGAPTQRYSMPQARPQAMPRVAPQRAPAAPRNSGPRREQQPMMR